jgi:hypothetical protein
MVSGLLFRNARTWREAAAESLHTSQMTRALEAEMNGPLGVRVRQLVQEQAHLISTFPSIVVRRAVAVAAAAQQQSGGRTPELLGMGALARLARPRALLIARTQMSKANGALTQARGEELGLPWYVWETSQDERVRKSHLRMQGILVRYDNPPSPEVLVGEKSQGTYNAGDIYNCRCYRSPLVTLNQVKWPHRVYWGTRVQYMTRSDFQCINFKERAA